ncbi:MAG: FGGY-family carbohydrate kinase [Victivallales bacterium]
MSCYLAIDLGASSGRGIVGKFENKKLELSEIHRFPNGPVEKDGSLFWDIEGLFKEIKTALKKAASAGHKINGIAIDTWGVDYAMLGKDGKFTRDPYHYRDSRTNDIAEKLFKIIPVEKIYERTGIQFMQLNSIFQIFAHKRQHPGDLKDSTFLMMPDILSYMLCGKVECEYTDASTTQLLDAKTGGWDFELIEKLGIPRSIFPKIVRPCTKAGVLKEELQKELGCGPVPVFRVGSHDTASAVASVPVGHAKNWAYISCGTWALLGIENDKPVLTEKARLAGYTNEGGLDSKIRFLTNIMGLWLLQECSRNWKEQGKNYSYSDMVKMAEKAEPMKFIVNPNNQKFLAPCDMPAKIKEYCKETKQGELNDDGAVVRCVLDSLALCFRAKTEELQSITGVRYECLNIVGGGCQNKLLMQLSADALDIPVIAGPVEATAIGNLMAQAIADGKLASLADGREIVKASFPVETYKPQKKQTALFEKSLDKFRKLP